MRTSDIAHRKFQCYKSCSFIVICVTDCCSVTMGQDESVSKPDTCYNAKK